MSNLWIIVEGIIMNFILSLLLFLVIFIAIYIPYIIFIAIIFVIIRIITTEKIASKILKTLIIIVVLLYATIIMGSFKSETSNDVYKEIKEMNDKQSLIGLSKEKVIELLGKPKYEYNSGENETKYEYYAGEISKESYWGFCYSHEYYEFKVFFDENGRVKHTSMKLIP